MCVISALISIFNLIMTLCVMFADEESRLPSMYSSDVSITLIVVSIVLLIIGYISAVRKDKEKYPCLYN